MKTILHRFIVCIFLVLVGCTNNTSNYDWKLGTSVVDHDMDDVVIVGKTSTVPSTSTSIPTISPNRSRTPDMKLISENFPTNVSLITKDFAAYLRIFDLDTFQMKSVILSEVFIDWENQGCAMLIKAPDGSIEQVDLEGYHIDTVFDFNTINDPRAYSGAGAYLSPDREWLWYYRIGEKVLNELTIPYPLYEKMDIITVSITGDEGPHQISINGGSQVEGSWSPDGNHLAFVDYDEEHNRQLFLSNKYGENRMQISHFDEEVYYSLPWIDDISWSPDGEKVSINYFRKGGEEVWVYWLQDPNAIVSKRISAKKSHYWIDEDKLVLTNYPNPNEIVLYHSDNDIEEILLNGFFYILNVYPFQIRETIGFVGSFAREDTSQFYIYSLFDHTLTKHRDLEVIPDLLYWTATPIDFPGWDMCNSDGK